MLISFPFLPGANNGSADTYEQAALSEIVNLDDYESSHGIYPIGRDRRWHGGVHLTPKIVNEPVRAIADGVVVAYRVASEAVEGHDTGFVLLKHETETGTGRSITFYSLYMHLMNQADFKIKPALKSPLIKLMQTPTDTALSDGKTKVSRKDILGYPGMMFGHRMIHFEIFMTGEGFEAYFAKTQLDNRTISATSNEEPWGDCYFIIPPGPFLSAPDQSSAEAGRSEQTLFARIRFDRGTKYTTVWRDEGAAKAPVLITPAAGVAAPNYEYDLYKTATKLYPDCASAGYELLRFGRVVGPDADRLPADKRENWQSISFTAEKSGYVNLSDARVYKLSDADFPWFMGWTKVSESAGALSDDGLCDSKVILDLLQEANGADAPSAHANVDRLASYLHDHEEVRQKLRGLICEAPTEWDKSTNHQRFDRLTQAGEHYEGNAEGLEKFLQFVEQLQFWDKTGLPTKVWHFHPVKFVDHFRKCGWLSNRELVRATKKSIINQKGVREESLTWQEVINRLNTGNATRPSNIALHLNKMMQKYGIVTGIRQAHFFGQIAAETGRWRTMVEGGTDDYFAKYDPGTFQGTQLGNTQAGDGKRFKGRGLIQLTGRELYTNYGLYRGSDFLSDAGSVILQTNGYTTCDTSGYYWASKQKYVYDNKKKLVADGKLGINYWADFGPLERDTVNVTKRINPGLNHLYVRLQCFLHALYVVGDATEIPANYDEILEKNLWIRTNSDGKF